MKIKYFICFSEVEDVKLYYISMDLFFKGAIVRVDFTQYLFLRHVFGNY
jgi:hypothetical protein